MPVTIWNKPLFRNPSDVVNAGDPRPAAYDPRLCVLEYPLGSGRYLSLDAAGNVSSATTEGTNERFMESNPKGILHAERNDPAGYNGPFAIPIAYGKL